MLKRVDACCHLLVAFLGLAILLSTLQAYEPEWWENQGVIVAGGGEDDFAPANQGQLKFMAAAAMNEMGTDAGPMISNMVHSWGNNITQAKDYSVATVGQLKAITQPFYVQLGLTYPWTETTTDDSDFAIATLGQLKFVFNFKLSEFGIGEPVISVPATITGTKDIAFSLPLTVRGGPTGFSAVNLPPGLGINPATGTISGTPTESGTYTALVQATNAEGADTEPFHFLILPPSPAITSPSTVSGNIGTAFYYQITANNEPTTYTASNLPPGIFIDSSTGEIYGVPTQTGTYSLTVTANTEPAGVAASKVLSVTIASTSSVPVIQSASSITGEVGSSLFYKIVATNTPTSYGATNLPGGLYLNPLTGTIEGTLAWSGVYSINLSATNASGTGNATLILTAPGIPVITSPSLVYATAGQTVSYQITATGSPISYAASDLPSGFFFNASTHTFTGAPSAAGTIQITLSATNASGSGTLPLMIAVKSGSAHTQTHVDFNAGVGPVGNYTSTSATIQDSSSYSQADGIALWGLNVGNLDSSHAVISRGLLGFNLSLMPPDAMVSTANLTMTIPDTGNTLTGSPIIELHSLSAAFVPGTTNWADNSHYDPAILAQAHVDRGANNWKLDKLDGMGSNLNFKNLVQSVLGLGKQLNLLLLCKSAEDAPNDGWDDAIFTAERELSGYRSPATDLEHPILSLDYTTDYPPVIFPQNALAGVGVALTYSIKALNTPVVAPGTTPTIYHTVDLPWNGLSLNATTGIISGTPLTAGSHDIRISAVNNGGTSSGTIPIKVDSWTLRTAFQTPISFTVPSARPSIFTNAGESFPDGLNLNSKTGEITGQIDSYYPSPATIAVTDSYGTNYVTIIFSRPISTAAPALENRVIHVKAHLPLDNVEFLPVQNGATSFNCSPQLLSDDWLSLSLSVDGKQITMSGIPPSVQTRTFQISATNEAGSSASKTVTLVVDPSPVPQIAPQTFWFTTTDYGEGNIVYSYSPQEVPSYDDITFSAAGISSGLNGLSFYYAGQFYFDMPQTPGTYSFNATVHSTSGQNTAPITIKVVPPGPIIKGIITVSGKVGQPLSYNLPITDATTVTVNMPAGLTITNSEHWDDDLLRFVTTWNIAGTPTGETTYTTTLSATNEKGTNTADISFDIKPAPMIPSPQSAMGRVDDLFNFTVSGNVPLQGFTATNLPSGLSISTQGLITGTPTEADLVDVGLTASDTGQISANAKLTLAILPRLSDSKIEFQPGAALWPLAIIRTDSTDSTMANSTLAMPESFTISTTNSGTSSRALMAFDLSSIPPDATITGVALSLTSTGGTGSAPITLEVHECADSFDPNSANWANNSGYKNSILSYLIKSPTTSGPCFFYGTTTFTQTIQMALGTSNKIYLALLAPKATEGSTTGFVGKQASSTAPKLTIYYTIGAPTGPPVITSPISTFGTIGATFAYTITATNRPTTFATTALPEGLTLNATTGVIQGTPTTVGSMTVALGATNAIATGHQDLTINIDSVLQSNALTKTNGDAQIGSRGAVLPQSLEVQASFNGSPLANTLITFKAAPGNGTLGKTSNWSGDSLALLTVKTDANGKASVFLKLPPTLGVARVTASAGTAEPVTFLESVVISPTEPSSDNSVVLSIISGGGQKGSAGETLPQPIIVQAENSRGQPVSSLPMTFSVTKGGCLIGNASSYSGSTNGKGQISISLRLGAGPANLVTGIAPSGAGGQARVYLTATTRTDEDNTPPQPGGEGSNPTLVDLDQIKVKNLLIDVPDSAHPENIKLTWDSEGSGIAGYVVEKRISDGPWKTLAWPPDRSQEDSGLEADIHYQYRVRAKRIINGIPEFSEPSNLAGYTMPLVRAISVQQEFYETNDSDGDHNDEYLGVGHPGYGPWEDYQPFGPKDQQEVASRGGTSSGPDKGYEDEMELGKFKFKLNPSRKGSFSWRLFKEGSGKDQVVDSGTWSNGGSETSVYDAYPPSDGTFFVALGATMTAESAGGTPQDSKQMHVESNIVKKNAPASFTITVPSGSGFTFALNFDGIHFTVLDSDGHAVSSGQHFDGNPNGTVFTVVPKEDTKDGDSMTVSFTATDAFGGDLGSDSAKFVYRLVKQFSIPLDEASGPKYRKIALNGMPMPDEKPQKADETDQTPEETFVDALTLGLRHSTTDIYIPIPGSEFAISARRDVHSEVWNMRSGVRPDESPDRPFGVCWSSSLAANIHFAATRPRSGGDRSKFKEPDKAYVTDEGGAVHTFYEWYQNGSPIFFPMPSSKNDQQANLESLTVDSAGSYVFTRKYGSTLVFEPTLNFLLMFSDRLEGSEEWDIHWYARLKRATDRVGNTVVYTYEGNRNLVPKTIQLQGHPDVKISIQQTNGRVSAIWDANGNKTSFAYDTLNYANGERHLEALSTVTRPDDSRIGYTYEVDWDPDLTPRHAFDNDTPTWHCDLTSIADGLNNSYAFHYARDTSKWNYMKNPDVYTGYYLASGLPKYVSQVDLPEGLHVTFDNQSKIYITYDANGEVLAAGGTRKAVVTDASGFSRTYEFDDATVVGLPLFAVKYQSDDLIEPAIFCYQRLTIRNGGYGYERFWFDIDAGLALSKTRDLSGNVTTFNHTDRWTNDSTYRLLMSNQTFNGKYGDPTSQVDAANNTKTFTYAPGRIMNSVRDEEGRLTSYEVDARGRRTKETIHPKGNDGAEVQVTEFRYDNPDFPGFLTQKVVKSLSGSPSWCKDMVTTYTPDANGRIAKEVVSPNNGLGTVSLGEANASTLMATVPLNLVTSYEYDANGNKTCVTDPRGYKTWFSYDKCNHLITVTHPDGSQKNFIYDLAGNKIKEYDENGYATLYRYDGLNRLTDQARDMNSNGTIDPAADLVTHYTYTPVNSKQTETDPENHTTTYKYDGIQRLTRIIDADGNATKYAYPPRNSGINAGGNIFDTSSFKPTTITDPRRYVTTMVYDKLYRLTQKQVAYGGGTSTTSTDYDNVGNPVLMTDPVGNHTHTDYDALNRPTITTYQNTATSSISYTSTGLKWKVTDENGHTIETISDTAGRPIDVIGEAVDDGNGNMLHPETISEFDASGNEIARTDPLGHRWDYTFDSCNRKIAEFQPSVLDAETGGTVRPSLNWEYDGMGQLVGMTDARGGRTDNVYDAANRLSDVYEPLAPVAGGGSARPHTSTTYYKTGSAWVVTDANGHTTTNTYDALNRLKTTKDGENHTVTYGYDSAGNRTDVWDGLNQHTQFSYDGLNRNTAITDAWGQSVSFLYDGLNKRQRLDAEGRQTDYDYDARNRLHTITYNGRSSDNRTYDYDLAGNLKSVVEPGKNGVADVFYNYDALNRQTSETSGGLMHLYAYDLAGNRLRTTYGGTNRVLASTYDGLNRLQSLTESPNTNSRLTLYGYDKSGNVYRKTLPNGDTVTTTHDALNRAAVLSAFTSTNAALYSYTYGYDLVDNLKSISETHPSGIPNRAMSMVYDNANRLRSEAVTTGATTVTTGYTYDAANNFAMKTVTGGSPAGTTTYHFNSLNQLTSTTGIVSHSYTYDRNGNRTARSDEDTLYKYDYENRLVYAFDIGTNDRAWDYVYDYRSRRVGITEHDGPLAATTKIVFSGGTSAQEYAVNGTTNTLAVEYVRGSDFGGGVGGILYTLRGTTPSYTHSDRRGDVIAKTSASGAVTYAASYQAFGKRTQESGSTTDRQKANSKDEDPTGFLNEGMRYRDLETGVFITRDPAGFVDGPNLYSYVVQNPWSKFDPKGLESYAFYQNTTLSEKHPLDVGFWRQCAERDVGEKNAFMFNTGKEIISKLGTIKNSDIDRLDFFAHSFRGAIGGNGDDSGIYRDILPEINPETNLKTGVYKERPKGENGKLVYVSDFVDSVKDKLAKKAEIRFMGCNSADVAYDVSQALVRNKIRGITVIGATNKTTDIGVVGREVVRDTPGEVNAQPMPNREPVTGKYISYIDGVPVKTQKKIFWNNEKQSK